MIFAIISLISNFKSPYWHEKILKEREKGLREGADRFVDWEQAKKEILESVS